MGTLLLTFALMGIFMLMMSVGIIFSDRPLRGSCQTGSCSCEPSPSTAKPNPDGVGLPSGWALKESKAEILEIKLFEGRG